MILLFAALVDKSCSALHPLSVRKAMMEKLKRQTPEQDECVEAKINETLPGSECVASVKGVESHYPQSKKLRLIKTSSTSLSRSSANRNVEMPFCRLFKSAEVLKVSRVFGNFSSEFVETTEELHVSYRYFDGATNINFQHIFLLLCLPGNTDMPM